MDSRRVVFVTVTVSVAIGIFACAWFVGYIISTYVFGDEFGMWNIWCAIFGNLAICPFWMIFIIGVFMWKKMMERSSTELSDGV